MSQMAPIVSGRGFRLSRYRSIYFACVPSRSCSQCCQSEVPSYRRPSIPKASFRHPSRNFTQAGRRRSFSRCALLGNRVNLSSIATSSSDSATKEGNLSRFDRPFKSNRHRGINDRALERFTHFALNPNTIPLGCMTNENWVDILDAIDAWIRIGGGFATDSADRLLERLRNEHAVSFVRKHSELASSSLYMDRSNILHGLERDVLDSWVQSFLLSGKTSLLALSRAEKAAFRFLKGDQETEVSSSFAMEQCMMIVEGYLQPNFKHRKGAEKAGKLLRTLLSLENDRYDDPSIAIHATTIGSLFEECVSRLMMDDDEASNHSLAVGLIDAMTFWNDSGIFPEIKIPDVPEHQRRVAKDTNLLSRITTSLDTENTENRLLDLLKNGTVEEQAEIHDLVNELMGKISKNDIVIALIEYYIRVQDSERASNWLQKLDPSILILSFELVENVLESWLVKKDLDVALKVDDFFNRIAQRVHDFDSTVSMSNKSYNLVVSAWSATQDPSASSKIAEYYEEMASKNMKLDSTTLKIALDALLAIDIQHNHTTFASWEVLRVWEETHPEEKLDVANAIFEAIGSSTGTSSDTIFHFLNKIMDDDLLPTEAIFQSSLSVVCKKNASPTDILNLVAAFENSARVMSLTLYKMTIDALFNLDVKATSQVELMYDRALNLVATEGRVGNLDDLSEFLYSIIAMNVNRKLYSEAEKCLKKAEKYLLKAPTGNETLSSPIPLKCYKKIIIRNWYTTSTARKVQHSFESLMNLHLSGYDDLQPDSDLYTAYIQARAADGKNVHKNLDDLIEQYESTKNEKFKPGVKVFNTVLLSLGQGRKNLAFLHSKSTSLLSDMTKIGVQPDIKTINLVLKNTIKGKYEDSYRTATKFLTFIDKYKLDPDSHTLHLTLDAFGSASTSERDNAITNCLSTFAKIRARDYVGQTTYGILSKVMYRLASRDTRADKIGGSVLTACCKDGMLTSEVRGRLRSMMSRAAWKKEYESHLSDSGVEPSDWSRKVKHKT